MRRRFLLPLLALLLLPAPVRAQPPGGERRLTVATLNLENLFDVFDDPYTSDETVAVKPREAIERAARTIRALDADVVALQEVENEGVLRAMVDEFLADMRYDYVAVGQTNSDRGIRLGVLSRLPIDSVSSYRFRELRLAGDSAGWRFARDVMHVRVRAGPDRLVHLLVVHLKSKHDSADDPGSSRWRLAEAMGLRAIVEAVLAEDPQAWLLALGDFNDTPGSETIDAVTGGEGAAAAGLTDLHGDLPEDASYTYIPQRYRSRIDYILASPAAAAAVVAGSARVMNEDQLIGGSDHAPVVATFDLEP